MTAPMERSSGTSHLADLCLPSTTGPDRANHKSEPAVRHYAAYRVTAEIRRLREAVASGARAQDRLHEPDHLAGVRRRRSDLGVRLRYHCPPTLRPHCVRPKSMVEPRIEPEIMSGLSGAPQPDMDEHALLSCIEWVAHGFEIAQSVFPERRFAAADTIAAFGLDGRCSLGRDTHSLAETCEWFDALSTFRITLMRNGADVEHGSGANVLDGPLSALRHLVGLVMDEPNSPKLSAGQMLDRYADPCNAHRAERAMEHEALRHSASRNRSDAAVEIEQSHRPIGVSAAKRPPPSTRAFT